MLLLIKGLGLGGAERLLVGLAANRDRTRFDYEVAYVLADQDALAPAMADTGIPVRCLGARGSADLRWLAALRRLVTERRYDLVHSHLPYVAAMARVVALSIPAARRPVLVYTEHSLWNRAAVLTRVLNRATVGMDSGLFVVSPAARRALPRSLRQGARVVVHGVDLVQSEAESHDRASTRPSVRHELGLAEDEVLALTVANLRSEKGLDVLVDAARLVREAGAPVRFAVAGSGPLQEDLQAAVVEAGIEDRFTLLGQRLDTLRLMVGSDLFVLPSRQEGMPVALMEAMSVGLPVVATEVGGVPDVVTDGREGLLVEVGTPRAMADAIGRLASDAALRARMGMAGRTRSRAFDIASAARQIEDRYAELLAARARRP